MTAQPIQDFLTEFEQLLDSDPEQALIHVGSASPELLREPEVRLAKAEALWATQGAAAAQGELESLLAEEPRFADAHHLLAGVCEELGEHQRMVEHFLEVWRLDADADETLAVDLAHWENLIFQTAEEVLLSLPSPFAELLRGAPIFLEAAPNKHLVEQGVDPRSLGLFEGSTSEEQSLGEAAVIPTRILLFTRNLIAACADEADLAREIEITVLHEIGHFFGLDEQDLERLGLD